MAKQARFSPRVTARNVYCANGQKVHSGPPVPKGGFRVLVFSTVRRRGTLDYDPGEQYWSSQLVVHIVGLIWGSVDEDAREALGNLVEYYCEHEPSGINPLGYLHPEMLAKTVAEEDRERFETFVNNHVEAGRKKRIEADSKKPVQASPLRRSI